MTSRRPQLDQVLQVPEKLIHMPFGLSSAWSSFCRLMEQCLGDQQFVTLLLYLEGICIFALDVSAMLKKCYFFQASMIFLGDVLSADGIYASPKKG